MLLSEKIEKRIKELKQINSNIRATEISKERRNRTIRELEYFLPNIKQLESANKELIEALSELLAHICKDSITTRCGSFPTCNMHCPLRIGSNIFSNENNKYKQLLEKYKQEG